MFLDQIRGEIFEEQTQEMETSEGLRRILIQFPANTGGYVAALQQKFL